MRSFSSKTENGRRAERERTDARTAASRFPIDLMERNEIGELIAFGEATSSGTPLVLVASEISTKLARPGVMRGALHESRDQAALFEPLAKAVLGRAPRRSRCVPSPRRPRSR